MWNSKQAYTNLDGEKSHIVNTAWAMLALMKAGQVFTSLSLQIFHMVKLQRASMVLIAGRPIYLGPQNN